MTLAAIVAIVFIFAMLNDWGLTAFLFGFILLLYACNGVESHNDTDNQTPSVQTE